jgi:competence ComEA-like helix-hairpin-helix protein
MGGGVFTREERAVVLFLVVSLSIGCVILGVGRIAPSAVPPFDEVDAPEGTAIPSVEPSWPVDINAADADDLTRLPGIGPARAAAIVGLRTERGAFGSVEELLDVKGIGPVTLERIAPLATAGAMAGSCPDSAGTSGSDQDRAAASAEGLAAESSHGGSLP